MASDVKQRLCMTAGSLTERCNIDRPELLFLRLPMPQRTGEPAHRWLQRLLDTIVGRAPPWALRGRIVVFCQTASLARTAAFGTDKNPHHCVRVPLPSCSGVRTNLHYVGTLTMPDPEQRRRIVEQFAATPFAVLFTTEAWSHGNGVKGTSMVVQAELPRGVVEFWQRSGRGARSVGERALVVQVVGAKMIALREMRFMRFMR